MCVANLDQRQYTKEQQSGSPIITESLYTAIHFEFQFHWGNFWSMAYAVRVTLLHSIPSSRMRALIHQTDLQTDVSNLSMTALANPFPRLRNEQSLTLFQDNLTSSILSLVHKVKKIIKERMCASEYSYFIIFFFFSLQYRLNTLSRDYFTEIRQIGTCSWLETIRFFFQVNS